MSQEGPRDDGSSQDGGASRSMSKLAVSRTESTDLSHNLLGQKLGRKGRVTRERILAATERLLDDPNLPLSLSAVAREASLAMTTIYLYFSDFTELLLAIFDPIMASAEEFYVGQLRERWPDEQLDDHCLAFVQAFHAFWEKYARALHTRNSYGAGDARMVQLRVDATSPLIDLLVAQMDAPPVRGTLAAAMATGLITGLERLVSVATNTRLIGMMTEIPKRNVPILLQAQARLLELGIRDCRAMADGSEHPVEKHPGD